MSETTSGRAARHALWLAAARVTFGAPALASPDRCLRMLGRSGRSDAARLFVGFFGVREVLLGVLMAALRRRSGQLTPVVALGALADIGDTMFLLRDLSRRGFEPATAMMLGSGLAGSAASVAVWLEAARARP